MDDIQDVQPLDERTVWLRVLDYWNVFIWGTLALIIVGASLLSGMWVLVLLGWLPAKVAWNALSGNYPDYEPVDQPIGSGLEAPKHPTSDFFTGPIHSNEVGNVWHSFDPTDVHQQDQHQ